MYTRIKELVLRGYFTAAHPQRPTDLARSLREDETGGMTAEMVIITAVLVIVATSVVAVIGKAIVDKANGIHF